MRKWFLLIAAMGLVLALAACGGDKKDEPVTEPDGVEDNEPVEEADEDATDPADTGELEENEVVRVDLIDAKDTSVGTAELSEEDNGVLVKVKAENLPEGPHGFHFHEAGKCESPDFESAGGHFNPTEAEHGLENDKGPHAGDLPNLEVGKDGKVEEEFVAELVTLKKGEANSLLQDGGTALVIHAEADDGTSQPSGDAGDRIVCGVIQ
ncbi:superoxide dismutase family protein [Sporosarcina sp. Marseille-Q4063]|uniref:superoxide dismutase family protein n=1 Tax=Sporosarcina sp. Marseille-Q4063 TaxID=2810514 RepID=UPI001BAFF38E|nr:superoxide dismutase family protein [Sporosarcina sp. Marseille-Q4063]QUW21458.1 superoxide dismutase family protein [Sporosarcina sp. Marseille-Q4063]